MWERRGGHVDVTEPGRAPSSAGAADFLARFDGDLEAAIAALRAAAGTGTPATTAPIPTPRRPARPRSGRALIDVTDLRKTYTVGRQKIQALDGVSLTIDEGEFVALVGASGSGKSTLLQLIGGLDKPSAGRIVVDGADIGRMRDAKLSTFRNSTIGFVFQFFYLQPFLQLVTNTEVPGMFAGTKRGPRREHALSLIDEVGLTERAKHRPREMSGGQMQRAAIARALLNRPKLLLADEPTGNLDSVTGATIMDLFEQIRDESGTTVVMVTHDEEMAARADRTIRLRDGLIVPQEVPA
ncbi:Lipoprotein-releasing system ATP-binding protein LolD (modular protein) [Phycicoccus elongatus Lp2]|jgi:ABC-type lipoprotein export system ATPase subunit|uniref:Lipoprotein-releasing system ATP-binding protein LolD (Modular protein) n=1 Tax=Phycicoccus elongatus Lp2 TaxID=1193181 RepID=N0E0C8_9MICO|nr:ABC transporter ATP-binding protein [Tetrasphaera sp.]MCB9407738.1 ABC transporter ATP-binding protein [Tetrasphaera sp.]CCH70418.1 Lipoprotein-releasing system ATP-binding protein LolD (modular protein) [Phycicoccus elongatus Lp2]